MKGLYLHTRDLRSEDNPLLNRAESENDKLARVFVLNKHQVDNNSYRSNNAILFMIECLQELSIPVYYGDLYEVIDCIFSNNNIDNFYITKDYTPFAKERDRKLNEISKKYNVTFITDDGYLLVGKKENAMKDDGTFYKKFTPFYNKACETEVLKPVAYSPTSILKLKGVKKVNLKTYKKKLKFINVSTRLIGGRSKALEILRNTNDYKNYQESRDNMGLERGEGTTNLSPYLKFNVVSPREVYEKVKNIEPLARQLYWRDFYMITMDVFGTKEIIDKTEKIKWENNSEKIKSFYEGRTGVPLIDASIREMLQTGSMHNRGRMNVSSFLIKVLHVDWRIGEKFFSQYLTDIDYCNNFGGWTWSSSLGYDSQPYFRIFNPYRQSQNHDPDCKYIRKWIPELNEVPVKDIHNWEKKYNDYTSKGIYIKPIIENISIETKITVKLYETYLK